MADREIAEAIIKNVYRNGEWQIITLKTGEEIMARVQNEMAVMATEDFSVCRVYLICDVCGEWVLDTEISFDIKRGCVCNECK